MPRHRRAWTERPAGCAWRRRCRPGLRQGRLDLALDHVVAYAAPCRIPDIGGHAAQPLREVVGDLLQVPTPGLHDRASEPDRHFRIVGYLSGREPKPAAPLDVPVNTIFA